MATKVRKEDFIDKEVISVRFNWCSTYTEGGLYEEHTVGRKFVTKIIPAPEMDENVCYIYFADGTIIRQGNINSIEFAKEDKVMKLKLIAEEQFMKGEKK